MKPKLLLCLALVLGNYFFPYAGTGAMAATNLPDVKMINPQESVHLPGLGSAIFSEQSSGFSLQVPVGFRKGGEEISPSNTNTANVQAWLLKTDGTAVPQSEKPSMITLGAIADYATDYRVYDFAKVPVNELAGVVVSLNGILYCHQMETSDHEPSIAPPDENLSQISPTNISRSPVSVQVADFDDYEHFTVFYKTDKMVSDKFLYARQELSDGDNVISSEPVTQVWTTNGARFEFGGGYVWPFKFKIIETGHRGETAMPGYSGYWFYLRDFVTNASAPTNYVEVRNETDYQAMTIRMPGLNQTLALTIQPSQYTVQMEIADFPDTEPRPMPKDAALHRQAWLLQADGSAIPQSRHPDKGGVGNAGWMSYRLVFLYPRKRGDNVAGVVVSLDGRLYCLGTKMTDEP